MRNIKLVIEYDGTNYSGWQVQPDQHTIQGEIESCIKRITGEDIRLISAGRTDTGVHALAQVTNFKTKSSIPARSIMNALNSILPCDITIKEAEEVSSDFDARRSSKGKIYKYLIFNRPYPSAIYRNFSWHVKQPLNIESMREGGALFIGEKDFSSFRASGCTASHPIRIIHSIDILKDTNGLIEIEIKGQAFLRYMVRIIVGTLVDLGRGKLSLAEIKKIIESKERAMAGMTAPAKGLFLKEVIY